MKSIKNITAGLLLLLSCNVSAILIDDTLLYDDSVNSSSVTVSFDFGSLWDFDSYVLSGSSGYFILDSGFTQISVISEIDFGSTLFFFDPINLDSVLYPDSGVIGNSFLGSGAVAIGGSYQIGNNLYFDTLVDSSYSGSSVTIIAYPGLTSGIPEPATLALMGLGLAGLGAARRKK